MKKLILAIMLIIMLASSLAANFAHASNGYNSGNHSYSNNYAAKKNSVKINNDGKIKAKAKKAKATAQRPMKPGQKTIICGQSGQTITSALSNINAELRKSSVKSHTAANLTVSQPFTAASAPIVHSETRKRSADVYVACVKIKKA